MTVWLQPPMTPSLALPQPPMTPSLAPLQPLMTPSLAPPQPPITPCLALPQPPMQPSQPPLMPLWRRLRMPVPVPERTTWEWRGGRVRGVIDALWEQQDQRTCSCRMR